MSTLESFYKMDAGEIADLVDAWIAAFAQDKGAQEIHFKQLKIYGDLTVLHPLNSKYSDIVMHKGEKYHIVGKVVKKVTVY